MMVVMAILTVLCAILFPVFAAARGAADRAVCISNLHTLTSGTHLYADDYDDRLMPVNQNPGATNSTSRNDRTWVQNLLPYVNSFSVFRCPADHTPRPSPETTYDQDLVPGDTDSQYYTASLRSNYGYNSQNLAPITLEGGRWAAQPRSFSQIAEPSKTLLFVESAWQYLADREPTGGGNWLVVPPCRYYAGSHVDSFTGQAGGRVPVFTTALGWTGTQSGIKADFEGGGMADPQLYGNAWPWHNGHMNAARSDGSVKYLNPAQLGQGCDVQEAWRGAIFDRTIYMWDIN